MATIGTFKQSGNNEFAGEIITLSVQAKNVRIVPEEQKGNENTRSARVAQGEEYGRSLWAYRRDQGEDTGLSVTEVSVTSRTRADHE